MEEQVSSGDNRVIHCVAFGAPAPNQLGAARAWHFQKPTGPGLLSKRPAGRAGPTGLPLHCRLANRESSRLVTFDSKTSSNIVLCHLEPHGVPGDHASNYFLAWPW